VNIRTDINAKSYPAHASALPRSVDPSALPARAAANLRFHAAILCGGSGTRLWPLSTNAHPKQLLSLLGPESMLAATAARVPYALSLTAVGGESYQQALRQELPDAHLILEPFGRNSAPAIAALCLTKQASDIVLVLPADHHIADVAAFRRALAVGYERACADEIVTFGIKPTFAATGYGYIETDRAFADADWLNGESFVEKPNSAKAAEYIASGRFVWNAGIFLFKVSSMLAALEQFVPDILANVRMALRQVEPTLTRLEGSVFAACRSLSIDYAVMEHLASFAVVPVDMGWSDVGDYRALHQLGTKDAAGNTTQGSVSLRNSSDCHVRSSGPALAISGLDGMTVVATPELVMIAPLGDAAAIKALSEMTPASAPQERFALWPAQQAWLNTWMSQAFRFWADRAWDHKGGGFVEALDLLGKPLAHLPRRARVQPRQVFAVTRAAEIGWLDKELARDLVEDGLRFILDTMALPSGGFAHLLSPQGKILNARVDSYDHAFLLLAAAHAKRVFNTPLADALVLEVLKVLDGTLRHPSGLGYAEANTPENMRRANPHMHLLEAFLALHEADPQAGGLERATGIVEIFETRLWDATHSLVREYYADDLTVWPGLEGDWIEPGHLFEWAVLLGQYDALAHRDVLSLQRRLIRSGNHLLHPKSGWACNAVTPSCTVLDGGYRLWPQLEMLRAYSQLPQSALVPAARLFDRICKQYLNASKPGLWTDAFSADGKATGQQVPASMLYHFITAFGPLVSKP